MVPHILATLVAILKKVHYEGYVTKSFEPMHKYKTLSFGILFQNLTQVSDTKF
jgi:hypothetical protein